MNLNMNYLQIFYVVLLIEIIKIMLNKSTKLSNTYNSKLSIEINRMLIDSWKEANILNIISKTPKTF